MAGAYKAAADRYEAVLASERDPARRANLLRSIAGERRLAAVHLYRAQQACSRGDNLKDQND